MYAMESIVLIRQFINDRLDTDPALVVSEALLEDLGVDSLMLAELMFEAEDRLNITMDTNVSVPKTVGEMAALIDTFTASKTTGA
jgi:acyl carrier protein